MLYKETVDAPTLELIQRVQSDPMFSGFDLAGGTALALHIGHRKSIDIDLFTSSDFDSQEYLEYLEKEYQFQMQYMHKNTLKGICNHIFIDIIKHDYPIIDNKVLEEDIRLLSSADISAMKVNAISGNGTRLKDFVDIYFLLKIYSFEEIIRFYNRKYGSRSEFHAVKSMGYFDDIISDDWPVMMLEKDITLEKVTQTISLHQRKFLDEIVR